MTSEEIKSRHRLTDHMARLGIKMVGSGVSQKTNVCPIKAHKWGHACVTVDTVKQLYHCNDCKAGGDIITWMATESGKSPASVLKELDNQPLPPVQRIKMPSSPIHEPENEAPVVNPTIEKTYQYHDAFGKEVFQVVRMVPKTFRQRHVGTAGEWIWNMNGVERVLYRLPEVLESNTVALSEGEKDAETLVAMGYCGTCNVGGAGKWLDGYTESLAGKDVLIFGDTDEAGAAHVELVFKSIAGKAKTVKIVRVPSQFKDITEYVESFHSAEKAKLAVDDLVMSCHPFMRGYSMPLYTMAEIEPHYKRYARNVETESLNLAKWLPGFSGHIRNMMPGEFVLIVGDTGVGKTALLSSIALSALPLPTIMFEVELPKELLFERFVAAKCKMEASAVEQAYVVGQDVGEPDLNRNFKNLVICEDANLTVEKMEEIIVRAELKLGVKPKLILVDYAQLLGAKGDSRYDRASNVAESIKRIAKSTGTIIVMASQRGRPAKDGDNKVSLHDAKESGSLENSAGLVLGVWRDLKDKSLLHLKVLKVTKGTAGLEIPCNFDGSRMIVTQRSPISDSDIPLQHRS